MNVYQSDYLQIDAFDGQVMDEEVGQQIMTQYFDDVEEAREWIVNV